MVAIVGGNALGLSLGSMANLGSRGVWGNAAQGRGGEQAYVNATSGNLVLRDQDDALAGRGLDDLTLRTYNSQGKRNDDNGDNWSTGVYAQQLRLVGTRNTAGSTVVRTDRDGAEASYAYDTGRGLYVSTAGSGAYDTVAYDTATTQFTWTDGDTGTQERYDSASGRLLTSRDPSGNTLSYTYNGNLLASVTTAGGETTFYDYSGSKLAQVRTVVVDAGVSHTLTRVHYAYDASSRLASVSVDLTPADNAITDGNVAVTRYSYDGTSQRIASLATSDGTSIAFTYVQVGTAFRIETATDALGNVTRYGYDTVARRTTVVDPMGMRTLFDYDAQGQIVKVTSPPVAGASESMSFVYSPAGDLVQTVDGVGRTVDMAYDANGNEISQRDALGNTVTRTFDARNQLLTETAYRVPDADGSGPAQATQPLTTRYVHDAAGRRLLRFVVSAEGRVTQNVYDGYGQRTSTITYGAAAFDVSTLAATAAPTEAQLTAWVGTQDLTRSMRSDAAYDVRGLLKTTTDFSTVDASGNGVGDAGRSITQFVHDQAGLLLKTISALDGTTQYTYDGLGRRITTLDAANQLTLTQYDDAHASTRVTLATGLTTTSAFDRAGRLVSVLQSSAAVANLGQTAYFYDADSRLRMTQEPSGMRQWTFYDEIGRKIGDVDAGGTLTESTYDASDRLTRILVHATAVDPATLVDADGKPKELPLSSIRPAASAADQATWRFYDGAGRLAKVVDASGAVTEMAYDGASRLLKTTAYATRVTMGTAGTGPASTTPPVNAADRVVRNVFDGDGLLLASLDGEGCLVENQYDAAGRLSVAVRYANAAPAAVRAAGTLDQLRPVASAADQRTVYLYNDKGQIAGVVDADNGLTETVYDGDGNVATTIRYATRLVGVVSPKATLLSLRPAGSAEDQVCTALHDPLDRVVQSTDAEGTQSSFVYDAVGRLVSSSRGVGTADVRTSNARYDVQGRLVGELSAEGAARLTGSLTQAQIDAIWSTYGVTHTYDAAGRRLSTTDQNGIRTLFYYDTDGRLTHTVDPLGGVSERLYDVLGQLASLRRYGTRVATAGLTGGLQDGKLAAALAAARNASLDSTETYTYNTTGTRATTKDARGNVTTAAYDAFGDVVSSTSPISAGVTRTDTASYDRRGLLVVAVSDSTGIKAPTSAGYDAFGRRTSSTDANGHVQRQSYDRLGRVVQTIDASTAARSTSYDAVGRVFTQTDANRQTTTYRYSTSARSVTVTTPELVSVTTVRTRFGQTYSVKDGKGQTTTFTYDRNGNLKSTTTPLTTTSQNYDKADRLIETVDGRGNKVDYAYDAANRVLTRTLDPAGLALVTKFGYDAKGQQISSTDPSGTVTTTRFDLGGNQLEQIVDPGGLALRSTWTYDARARVLTTTDAAGTLTQYSYDKLGRRVRELVDPAGLAIGRDYTYDRGGNVVAVTDGDKGVGRFVHDALDRVTWSVDAAGGVEHTEFDAEGRVQRTTRFAAPIAVAGLPLQATEAQIRALVVAAPGRDAVLARRYDHDGRLRFTVDGNGAVIESRFDANGNVSERIAYAVTIDLAAWNAGTDPVVVADAGRDRHQRAVYDQLDRLSYSADGVGTVTHTSYDGNGNVTRTTVSATPIAATVLPNAVTTGPDDRISVYAYDAANREIGRTDAFGAVTRTVRDAARRVVTTTRFAATVAPGAKPDTVVASAGDRLSVQALDRAGRVTLTVDAAGAVTTQTYDGDGRIGTTTRYARLTTAGAVPTVVVGDAADRAQHLEYDHAGRLATSTDALGGTQTFTYDGLGNKLTFTNEKGSVWTYTYDAAGRLATETTPVVTTVSATASGSLLLVDSASVDAGIVTRMAYDGLGNLLSRTEAAGRKEERTTWYAYDAAGRQVRVTYPPVAVYDETTTALASNGLTGLATRAETPAVSLVASTVYDALGNAVANADVAGVTTLKAYDRAGRVVAEVDGRGFVTAYRRDAFGAATSVTRYATASTLGAAIPADAAHAPTAAAIAAAVVASSADRTLATTYDRLGRVATVREPTVFTYDSTTRSSTLAAKKTSNTYDAFGEVTQQVVSRDTSIASSPPVASLVTWSYFDKAGNQTASIDPAGFLTRRSFDAVGNVTTTTEFATAMSAGNWTASGYTAPAADATDRTTVDTYDGANRKTSETRLHVEVGVAVNGAPARRADLTTTFGYDAVGNLTSTATPNGASADDTSVAHVYSFYDALGRITAVASPARSSTADGGTLTPLTTFRRDAYGNVVEKVEYAKGAAVATEFKGVSSTDTPGFTAAPRVAVATTDGHGHDVPVDRVTVSLFDASGHATQTQDATGTSHFFSYDARGQLAKTWQLAFANDATPATTLFEAYGYDGNGQLTHTLDPAANNATGVTDTVVAYDAFGDVTQRGLGGEAQTYFDYDNAGHLWRSNAGDGVDKVFLYDALGRQTAQITSAGGVADRDLHALSSPDVVAALTDTRRTDSLYDADGHMTSQVEASRATARSEVRVVQQVNTALVTGNDTEPDGPHTTSTVKVQLSWASLASLGSGDVQVQLSYAGPTVVTTHNETKTLSGSQGATGTTFSWTIPSGANGGQVTRFVVLKKDVHGDWQKVIDCSGDAGATGSTIDVAAPADPTTAVTLQVRLAGSTGAWAALQGIDFGDALRFDTGALKTAVYDYRVQTLLAGGTPVTAATGTLTYVDTPLQRITTPIGFASPTSSTLRWLAASSIGETFRYRATGSTGAWSAMPVTDLGAGYQGVDLSSSSGSVDYELLWSADGNATAYAHAVGSVTITPAAAATTVPAVGVPNLTGIGVGTKAAGSLTVNGLYWNAVSGFPSFSYRLAGSTAWTGLGVNTTNGIGWVSVAALAPARYEFQIVYTSGSTTTWLGTGILTVGTSNGKSVTVTTPPYTASSVVSAKPKQYAATVATVPGSVSVSGMRSQGATLNLLQAGADLPAISTSVAYQDSASGLLAWQAQPAAVVQTFRYRAAADDAWRSLAIGAAGVGFQGVDTSVLGPGAYQYELQWASTAGGPAFAHGQGTFTVADVDQTTYVAPVGTPNVTGIGVGSRTIGSTTLQGLYWDAPFLDAAGNASGAPATLGYRLAGTTTWSALATSSTGAVAWANLASLATGRYEFSIAYGSSSAPVALGTGTLTVDAPGVVDADTVRYDNTQVPVYTDVVTTPPDPSSYIVGSSQGTYGISVDPGATDGSDELYGGAGSTLQGLAGDDELTNYSSSGTLVGGTGDDWLTTGTGTYTVDGGAGDDIVDSNGGTTTALFGRGDGQDYSPFAAYSNRFNTLQFKPGVAASDVVVTLVNGRQLGPNSAIRFSIRGTSDSFTAEGFVATQASSSVYNSVQRVAFDDGTIWDFATIAAKVSGQALPQTQGGTGNDTLVGTAGDDYLVGNGGDDTLDGGAGEDWLDGGLGNNTYLFGIGDGQDRITYENGLDRARINTLQFKAGVRPGDLRFKQVFDRSAYGFDALEISIAGTNDHITVDKYFALSVQPGDTVPTRAVNPIQQLRFADGTVWSMADIDGAVYKGSADADRIFGQGPNVQGGDGGDLLFGTEQNDVIQGGAGNDQLIAGGGDDTVEGGTGNDRIDGGTGNNTYLFGRGDGIDVVSSTDYTAGRLNTLQFKAGVKPTDLLIRHVDNGNLGSTNGLDISILGTTDKVILRGYSVHGAPPAGVNSPVQQFKFDDGTVWNLADVEAHIDTSKRPIYGAPIVLGRDDQGDQILAPHYAWSGNAIVAEPYATTTITGYTTVKTPVYGRHTVTTAPYTPGTYTTRSVRQYANAALPATAVDPALRPVVTMTRDRWGNVLAQSDARNGNWTTRSTYNANDEVTSVSQPGSTGEAGGPTTRTYYDAQGRAIGVADALNHLDTKDYDAGGNLVAEHHADGGIVTSTFDAFGDKVSTTDALGNASAAAAADHTTAYRYDSLGRLTSTTTGMVNVWGVSSAMTLTGGAKRALVQTITYDTSGRKVATQDGGGRTVRYQYDRLGDIVSTLKSGAVAVTDTYDTHGHKTSETDENKNTSTWETDAFGRLRKHTDIGGRTYVYTYDDAGQLTQRQATGASLGGVVGPVSQNLNYSYDAAGELTQVVDDSLSQVTTYAYDLSGRRVLERTVQGTATFQDNHLAYDATGRLRDVADTHVHASFDYDAAGNRTHVRTSVNVGQQGTGSADDIRVGDRFFLYDTMNRQTSVDAVDAQGDIGQQGHTVTYDKNGNRSSDTFYGNQVIDTHGTTVVIDFDAVGEAIYGPDPGHIYTTGAGVTTELYAYDAMDRLQSVVRDGVQVDLRAYDGSSDVVSTGPGANLPKGYAEALNANVANDAVIGDAVRVNRYDTLGRLQKQSVFKSDNRAASKYDITYAYDAAGNVQNYLLANHDGSDYTNTYKYTNAKAEGYRQTQIDSTEKDTKFKPGQTRQYYDQNGFLTSVYDGTKSQNSKTFINDVAGHALLAIQNGNSEHQFVVDGEVLGQYGSGIDAVNPRDKDTANPIFAPIADFNFGYQPINGNYPTASAGSYAVRAGDTLKSIAQGAYGDAELWYRIADANGLAGDGDLRVGETLTVPNRVGTIHNTGDDFKPYDPSKIVGDTTPNMSAPAASDKGCGGLGLILVIVVAIVVTVYTAGLLSGASGALAETFSAGASTLAGTSTVVSATTAVEISAVAGAVGSIASQLVADGLGLQHGLNWKAVALSAIGAAVGSEVGELAKGSALGSAGFTATVTRAAITNAATQGISVLTGLQHSFSWSGLAGAAVGTAVSWGVGNGLGSIIGGGPSEKLSFEAKLLAATLSGTAAGLTVAMTKGGRANFQQVAVDAFGSALGNSLAAAPTPELQGAGPNSSMDYRNGADIGSDSASEVRARNAQTQADLAQILTAFGGDGETSNTSYPSTLVADNSPAPPWAKEGDAYSATYAPPGGYMQIINGREVPVSMLDEVVVTGSRASLGRSELSSVAAFQQASNDIRETVTADPRVTPSPADFMALESQMAESGVQYLGPGGNTYNTPQPPVTVTGRRMTPAELDAWEDKEYGSIRALEPSLWERTWLNPTVQMTLPTLPFGSLGSAAIHTIGSAMAGFRDDGYNFATGQHLNLLQQHNSRIDTFISLATMPIGMGAGRAVTDAGFSGLQAIEQSTMRASVMSAVAESQMARHSSRIDPYFARESQVQSGYAADQWSGTTLREGSVIYALRPGESQYFTDFATVQSTDLNSAALSRALQVKPHDIYGYRPDVAGFRLEQDLFVPSGQALANPWLGPGGGTQYFVRNWSEYVQPVSTVYLKKTQ